TCRARRPTACTTSRSWSAGRPPRPGAYTPRPPPRGRAARGGPGGGGGGPGAIEAESASFAIDKIDQSIAKYSETLASRSGKDTQS
ncbi:hypothetical protein OFL39_09515, partial [Pseudomonas aeruginosa]|nr:hypothetical protein [Pseudomonas aeruginosa]